MSLRFKMRAACAVVATTAAFLAAAPIATGAPAREFGAGLDGPRGVAVGPAGRLVVAEANGVVSKIVRKGPERGDKVRIGRVPKTFVAPAVDVNSHGRVFALNVAEGADGTASLYRFTRHGREKMADIAKYQRSDPDPYNLDGPPKESNPYGVAALDDGSALVADAAANDLLRVWPNGTIKTVARVKPRTILAPDLGDEGPPEGSPVPTEAVITSVAVGPDGSYYIGELRGFPATPGTSQIWRIKPGTTNAVCNPRHPRTGDCRRYVDGLTSVVDLSTGRGGAIYAVELSKLGWLAMENGVEGAEIGALIRISHDRMVRRELAKDQLVMPGGVAVGRGGAVFATTPIFGPGRVLRVD